MKFILLSSIILFSIGANAQFFKTIPKLQERSHFALTATAPVDSSAWSFRPIVIAAAYSEPGNRAEAGIGVSYQKNTWNATTQKWNCDISISAIGFAGGSVVPTSPNQITSIGIGIGLFNNLLIFGPSLTGNQFGGFVSIGVSLNN